MPFRSGLSQVVLVVASLAGAPMLLVSCSSPERHDSLTEMKVSSCEASNTCDAGGGSLPPIIDPQIVAGPCGHGTGNCVASEGGVYDAPPGIVEDAEPEAAARPDVGVVVDSSDASRPIDGGPG